MLEKFIMNTDLLNVCYKLITADRKKPMLKALNRCAPIQKYTFCFLGVSSLKLQAKFCGLLKDPKHSPANSF